MKNRKDEKWLDENISRAVDFGEVKLDTEKWKEKYNLDESAKQPIIKHSKNMWRYIMESRITKYSAAAVVALAFLLVLFNPFGGPKYGGVVLAQVQQKLAESDMMIITGTKTYTSLDNPDEAFEFAGIKWDLDIVKYLSDEFGLVEEGYIDNELIYRITFNKPQRKSLMVMPVFKKYLAFNSPDDQIKLMENLTPQGMVNLLTGLGHKDLGRENIEGVEVEGFEFEGSQAFTNIFPKFIFDIQSYKGKIWIGIEEQLPIWCESDLLIGKSLMTGLNELNLHEFNFIEQYNANIDESVFDISIPDDYTELTISDILNEISTSIKVGAAGIGLGVILVPVGFVRWKRRKRKIKVRK